MTNTLSTPYFEVSRIGGIFFVWSKHLFVSRIIEKDGKVEVVRYKPFSIIPPVDKDSTESSFEEKKS
jgi:hypothetical protein